MRAQLKKQKDRFIEENFFRPRWYSIVVNPYFINRWSLYRAVREFAANISTEDEVLDVGCGLKPYRTLCNTSHYLGIDIEGGGHVDEAKRPDKFFDGKHIPCESNTFSRVLCTQVLEHAQDPETLVREIYRVAKSGAQLFVSMPFVYPEHETPYDFRRYTQFQHRHLMESTGFSKCQIRKTTGFMGTFGQLLVVWLYEGIPFRAPLLKLTLSVFVFAPIQALALLGDWLTRKSGPTMDYVVIAVK